jgi:hypothetical protein
MLSFILSEDRRRSRTLEISVNNSSATIRFTNGTCTPPVSIDFNNNVMIENQAAAALQT